MEQDDSLGKEMRRVRDSVHDGVAAHSSASHRSDRKNVEAEPEAAGLVPKEGRGKENTLADTEELAKKFLRGVDYNNTLADT